MPSLLSKINSSRKDSPQRDVGVSRRNSVHSNFESDTSIEHIRSRSPSGALNGVSHQTAGTPKLVLLADDDDEEAYDLPARRNSRRTARAALDGATLQRTVSAESAENVKPSRIVSANGYTGVILSDAAGPSAQGSLSLDHLVEQVQAVPMSVSMPEITLQKSSPDLGSPSMKSSGTDSRRDSLVGLDDIVLPKISMTSTTDSVMTITDSIPGGMRSGTAVPSAIPPSTLAPSSASPPASIGSTRRSLTALDSPMKARAIAGRLSRSPSRSSGGVGIGGALAASGMALASAHGQATSTGPTSAPMLARSATSSTEGDSDAISVESGRSRGNSIQGPSMEALSMWDVVGTGYALASARRNLEFHQLFSNVPEDDYLVEDYGCALARDILIQGRLYISEHHLCFNANIFGWVTTLNIPFSEIVSIEKKMTALVIPNAIQVATLHARHQFASFLSRDTTYDLLINIWRIFHPALPSVARSEAARSEIDPDEDRDDDIEEDDKKQLSKSKLSIVARRRRGKSAATPGTPTANLTVNANASTPDMQRPGSPGTPRSSQAHPTTQCACGKSQPAHFANVCMDAHFSTTPEKLYNLIFTSGFIKTFWAENQKLTEISLTDWAPGVGGNLSRSTQYIKPLNASVGPKSCKCLIKDETIHVDFDEFVTVLTKTQTPDVPSGTSFEIMTKTCITWARGGSSRVLVTTEVVWSKSSFLKGIITSSAISGQKSYHTELEKEMRSYIQQHRSEFVDASLTEDPDETTSAAEAEDALHAAKSSEGELAQNGERTIASQISALLPEPLKAIVEPISVILQDLFSGLLGVGIGHLVFFSLLALLAAGNAWSLVRSAWSSTRSTAPLRHLPVPSRQGEDVAFAVRSVLEDYFTHQQERKTGVAAKTSSEATEGGWPAEAEDLRRELEVLEGRVARLKQALDQLD